MNSLLARIRQGYHTISFPEGEPPMLPDRFLGRPVIDSSRCTGCGACAEICPTNAIGLSTTRCVDLGKCIFCGTCREACSQDAIRFEQDFRLSSRTREGLLPEEGKVNGATDTHMDKTLPRIFSRSLNLRQVSTGGCNACEADTNVLSTIGWDLGRFGIQFVASPRHADGILITGPVTQNMRQALKKTYDAVPSPKVVIAVGACAISGGIYSDHAEQCNGIEGIIPVDLYVPGCPPHPLTILEGLLRLLGRDNVSAGSG
ncbi:MAG: NADH-quinone oxidoreductase subunit NuoB [Anaerolineales bacterium]|nr:NADH-quinone oxidoreductase subunit NuoB [Anaerolineales bacterium]